MKRLVCLGIALVAVLAGCKTATPPLSEESTVVTTTVTTTQTPLTTTTVATTVTTTTKQTTASATTKQTTKSTTAKPTTARPTTAKTTVQTLPADTSAHLQEVHRLVNAERGKAGLAPLRYYTDAQAAADVRAKEIGERFSHTRPDGTQCFTALDTIHVQYYAAGENIASGHTDAAWVMQAWMDSDGHRANILNEDFNAIVVGYAEKDGVPCWVQLFLGV